MADKDSKLTRQLTLVALIVVVCGSLYFLVFKTPAVKDTVSTVSTLVNQQNATTTDTVTAGQASEQGSLPSSAADNQTSGDTQATSSTDGTVDATAGNSNATNSQKSLGTLTLETFDQVKNGLTYPEVTSIIGAPVKLVSEYGAKGTPERTASYLYRNDSEKLETIVVYKAGKVADKMEISLGENPQ